VNPDLSTTYPQAYGQLEYVLPFSLQLSVALIALARRLVSYADPADDTVNQDAAEWVLNKG